MSKRILLIGDAAAADKKARQEKLLKQSLLLVNEKVSLENKIKLLETEIMAATGLLWAMAKTCGGEVKVRKVTMVSMNSGEKFIKTYYNPETMETVISAIDKPVTVN